MSRFLKQVSIYVSIIVVAAIVFSSGFWAGRGGNFDDIPSYVSGAVNASNDVDFSAFWEVWQYVDQKYMPASTTVAVSDEERVFGAIKGMVDSLNDPYTQFLPPDENKRFEETIQGEFSGIGMEVGIKDDRIIVVAPLKNTPAEKAGILAGDVIIAIDGEPTASMSLDDAVLKIRGAAGTTVTLTIVRESVEKSFDISVVRSKISIPTLETKEVGDVFVISLYNFSANAMSEYRAALRDFVSSKKSKMILDLRGNPGGFLEAAVDIASWYLPTGKVVVREQFKEDEEEKVFRSKGYNIFNGTLRMVVLVDGGSASASEILAGALQEHDVATIVGVNTFGKGSVQELIGITKDTSLKVTIARWLTPEGKSISDGGLVPDVIVENTIPVEGETFVDLQMQQALELLK